MNQMTSDSWYTIAEAGTLLTQGDMVLDCPLIAWDSDCPTLVPDQDETTWLKSANRAISADVIVMTQACDLAQHKVANVTVCIHFGLSRWRQIWEQNMKAQGQNITPRNWQRMCKDIKDGFEWNLAMLNGHARDPIQIEHRIVDFKEVYTVPRAFLESLLRQRGGQRLQLLPPYREHLSQGFARFFMRVGLPTPIPAAW